MFGASELVTFCLAMVGMPYWYGTCVYVCTSSLLSRKAAQYPSHYGYSRMPTYKKHIAERKVCMDCIGMIKGFFWTNGGKGVLEYLNGGGEFSSKYGSNNCPDKGANGMLTWLKSKGCQHGDISTLPDVPGILLFKSGHVGVYVGGGYAVEAQGFAYGVRKTKVSKRPWKEWAYLPSSMLTYDGPPVIVPDADEQQPMSTAYKLGERMLKRTSPMMTGDDVKELQTRLNELGFGCGISDGQFGASTEKGVKAFQTAVGIDADGAFGKESKAALDAYSLSHVNPETDINTNYTLYAVQHGDNLWGISKKLLGVGGKWKQIADLNGLEGTTIHEGDVLKIPEG